MCGMEHSEPWADPIFHQRKKIDAKFTDDYGISEGAVDNGGPTQEFF